MKKIIVAMLLLSFVTGCTSSTDYGECRGLNDQDLKDPTLRYEASAWNLILSIVFVELIVPPVVVALYKYECPVGKK